MKTLLSFFLIFMASHLLAKNPRIYSQVNAPIYSDYQSIKRLKNNKSLISQKKEMNALIKAVPAHKKKGFDLDKKIRKKKIKPNESKAYLKASKQLARTHKKILSLVKHKALIAIEKKQSSVYYALYNSKLSIFSKDKKLIKAHKTFAKKYKSRVKKKKVVKKNYSGSYIKRNIPGTWRGSRSSDKARIKAYIQKNNTMQIQFKYHRENFYNLNGTYTIKGRKLTFNISSRTLYKNGKKHKRVVNLHRVYDIKKFTNRAITLSHVSGEVITLAR